MIAVSKFLQYKNMNLNPKGLPEKQPRNQGIHLPHQRIISLLLGHISKEGRGPIQVTVNLQMMDGR